MPDLPALFLLLPALTMPTLLDLAKIFGVPVALYLLARLLTRRDKLRDEAAAEETRVLKQRSETAEQERGALRADSERNKVEHERFLQALSEMRAATQTIQTDVQALKLDAARHGIHSEGFKETLSRVDSQLSLLINNYRKLA